MPLCGFNQKMIDGIRIFSEGLMDATLERGVKNGLTEMGACRIEVRDIDLFKSALKQTFGLPDECDSLRSQMVYGIAVFSDALLRNSMKWSADEANIRSVLSKEIESVTDFLQRLEDEHQRLKLFSSPDETALGAAHWMRLNDPTVVPTGH
jgi:hypothetical protein